MFRATAVGILLLTLSTGVLLQPGGGGGATARFSLTRASFIYKSSEIPGEAFSFMPFIRLRTRSRTLATDPQRPEPNSFLFPFEPPYALAVQVFLAPDYKAESLVYQADYTLENSGFEETVLAEYKGEPYLKLAFKIELFGPEILPPWPHNQPNPDGLPKKSIGSKENLEKVIGSGKVVKPMKALISSSPIEEGW